MVLTGFRPPMPDFFLPRDMIFSVALLVARLTALPIGHHCKNLGLARLRCAFDSCG